MSQALMASIAETITDYREGELQPPTAEHVERWVNQFPEASRLTILTEMDHLLKKTYHSKAKILAFLDRVAQTKELTGDAPADFWERVNPLNIQVRGKSQAEMLKRLEEAVRERYGVALGRLANPSSPFIYLDDVLFTGTTAMSDLSRWIGGLPDGVVELHLVFLATHEFSEYKVEKELRELISASRRPIKFKIWRDKILEDRKARIEQSAIFRPTRTNGDPNVESYANALTEAAWPPALRPFSAMPEMPYFQSPEGRDLLEWELLKAGAGIVKRCRTAEVIRPMGFHTFPTLGFGATVITHRNCPNNAPLALWWGDPNAPKGSALGWYPLFRRRIYTSPSPLAPPRVAVSLALPLNRDPIPDQFEGLDDTFEGNGMYWETEARESLKRAVESLEFDFEAGIVNGDGPSSFTGIRQLITYLETVYLDAWYTYVPFEGGEAVFRDDVEDAVPEAIRNLENRFRRLGWN